MVAFGVRTKMTDIFVFSMSWEKELTQGRQHHFSGQPDCIQYLKLLSCSSVQYGVSGFGF